MSTMVPMSRAAWGLGSIYRRKDGRWVAQVEHHGARRYVYGRTPAEVRDRLRTGGSPSPSRTPTVAAFLEEWLAMMAPPRLGVRTHEGYAAIVVGAIVPTLGDIPLDRLGRQDVETAVSAWSRGRHPRTVAHYLACLRAALGRAVEWGLIPTNPATRIPLPRIPGSRAAAFSVDDERRLLAAVAGDPLEPHILAALRTGLRQGELLGLRWEDWDEKRHELVVRHTLQRSHGGHFDLAEPKTSASRRTVPVGPELAGVLADLRKVQMARSGKVDQGLIFATPAGSPLPNDRVSRRFSVLVAEAGCAPLTFHAMRHTFATRLLERGVRIDVVMRLLGHSTITTTVNIYGHVTEDAKRAAIDRLEAGA